MVTISTWVSQIMLHVTDDWIMPVGEVDRAVGCDLDIGRSKVRVGRKNNRFYFGCAETRILFFQFVLENSLKSNHV